MLIHDNIKIRYSREGFLPDYPYHLISDEEMLDAFLSEDKECYFYDNYPCEDETLRQYYDPLVNQLKCYIDCYLHRCSEDSCPKQCYNNCKLKDKILQKFPDWIYSYMIGSTIGPNSHQYDIHDLLVMMNLDNIEDVITIEAYNEMYKISQKYVRKLIREEQLIRPPTIFGEPHVIKILRLEQTSI